MRKRLSALPRSFAVHLVFLENQRLMPSKTPTTLVEITGDLF
jgi:hypothetical protein